MPVIIDHEDITQQPSSREFGPANIPNGLTSITIRLARQTTATPTFWAPGVNVSVRSEIAINGTDDWLDGGGFSAPGGIVVGRLGEIPESVVRFPLPVATGRRIRFYTIVAGGELVTQLTLETN